MIQFKPAQIDASAPLYDGKDMLDAAFAVLSATSCRPANTPTVQAKVPTATKNTTRHTRSYRMAGQQVARRSIHSTARAGATRFTRMRDTFTTTAATRATIKQRDTRRGSARLMDVSRRNLRGPVLNHAQELDRALSRANAKAVVNALMRRKFNNLADLSDGVADSHHLFRHTRNFKRADNKKDNRVSPAEIATLMHG